MTTEIIAISTDAFLCKGITPADLSGKTTFSRLKLTIYRIKKHLKFKGK